jgi:tetratricopeptide (TPR) repeat protein
MLEELAAADPNNSKSLREVGFAYYELGKKLIAAKDYAGALESRRKAFTIRETVAAKDPRNAQARFDLAVAFADLSEAYTNTGEIGQAVASAQESLKVFESLVVADPTNVVYSRNIGLCYEKLAEAFVRQASDERLSHGQRLKSWAEARLRYRQGMEVFQELRSTAKLMPADAGQPDRLLAKIKECDEAMQRLKQFPVAR